MVFINKLIKKVIFGCLIVFSFFLFSSEIKIQAEDTDETCQISLNDGDKYLVLNLQSAWNDSGVTITCSGTKNDNVSVSINGGTAVNTTNGGLGVSNSYVSSAGFYKIQYYLSSNTDVTITRHVRVLPSNMNNVKNIWLGENEKANTLSDDTFNKIIDVEGGYLAIGNFGNVGYVVKYNLRGEFLWSHKYEETTTNVGTSIKLELTDIIKSVSSNMYYIAGQTITQTTGENSATTKGFVRPIELTDTSSSGGGISNFGNKVELAQITQVNKIVKTGNYVFVAGYKLQEDSTRVAVVENLLIGGGTLTVKNEYINNITSEYNSLIFTTNSNSEPIVVAVGNTSVANRSGATAGLITVCTDEESFACVTKDPYFYLNNNGLSTTITTFKDIAKYGDNYLVVGESRIDRINTVSTSINSGLEDSLVVLLDSNFVVADAKLRGSSSSDSLTSIKEINSDSFIAVGKRASVGYYVIISYENSELTLTENTITGNLSTEIKDVYVQKSANLEIQYIFVGNTQATNIEGIYNSVSGSIDAMLVILDMTQFDNYENIDILKNSIICKDGNSTSCDGNNMKEDYFLKYGDRIISFPTDLIVSSENVRVYNTFHDFSNIQGISFKIGRIISINDNPMAPDITMGEIGIDKWYLYSRPQVTGSNVANFSRQELWSVYYYPLDNNLTKDSNTTYYVFDRNSRTFIQDTNTTRGYTYNNYIQLPAEPQNSTVAFQSKEKAYDFAILQEFTRIALVSGRYNDNNPTGISYFQNELAALSAQNYYFVYYIDLSFGTGSCGLNYGVLGGNCTAYTGYAFASLSRIKTIANLIVENNNYFVSESNNRFNPSSGVSTPVTTEYKEELSTIRYLQNTTINLSGDLQLVIDFYPINENGFSESANEYIEQSTASVLFGNASGATYVSEGKYTVKYCYNYKENNEHCGASATFVIDYTAPIINYILSSSGALGQVTNPYSSENPKLVITDIQVMNISDIDPYAYTIIDGVKYYLRCNSAIATSLCNIDLTEKVQRSFEYQSDDPDKIYEMHVYDRAGNQIDFYFKIGTEKPTIRVDNATGDNSFNLVIDFHNKNQVESLFIEYTKSSQKECEVICTENTEGVLYVLQSKIEEYIKALVYLNNQELLQAQIDPDYIPTITSFIELTFSLSTVDAAGNVTGGGVIIPRVVYDPATGAYSITANDNETFIITKGLYKFTLADKFENVDEAFGGIGIGTVELDIYISDDEHYDESDVENLKIPKTSEEIGSNEDNTVFLAKTPEVYSFIDKLQTSVMNDFNSQMFFTNQFVYIKFKPTTFGVISISEATALNPFNNYRSGGEDNLSCIFVIYGDGVGSSKIPTCANQISMSDINNSNITEALAAKGIYFVGNSGEYYYLAFTQDGTYRVYSEVIVETETSDQDSDESLVSVPIYYSFAIDSKDPVIDFAVECSIAEGCKGEKNGFTSDDFVYADATKTRINIGNNDMKLLLSTDILQGTNLSTSSQNKLLVVTINGETYNAFDYAVQRGNVNGDYLVFSESGIYEITLTDAGGNQIIYRFIIDKTPPNLESIVDINNKSFTEYQQYVEVRLTISEGSFLLNNVNDTMLTVEYWINSSTKNIISIRNTERNCVIDEGSGGIREYNCQIVNNGGIDGLTFTFVIPINESKELSNVNTLNVQLTDYFDNKGTVVTQSFVFDNEQPYIYFNSIYIPITEFGEGPTNEERERMLSMDANASLTNFICGSTDTLISDKVTCSDSPTNQGINNNVVVEAYEAARVAYNNYRLNGGVYESIANGTQLFYNDTSSRIYKRTYSPYINEANLQSAVSSGASIYTKGSYIQVINGEKIDPNTDYYYDNGATKRLVSIKDMYTNSDYTNYTTCDSENKKCLLYRMYIDNGNFTNNEFYTYDSEVYALVSDSATVETSNFRNYYYTTNNSFVEDEGKFLPALTLANTCVMVNGNCITIGEGRIKLKSDDNSIVYYNYMSESVASRLSVTSITVVNGDSSVTRQAVVDNRIWQIATQTTSAGMQEEARFRFGIASNLGRPIIFRAIDGAGNLSVNYLETVIAIRDERAPEIASVSSISYLVDERTGTTLNNYIKENAFYTVADTNNINCTALTEYYRYDNINHGYVSVTCGEWEENEQYYVKVERYVQVEDGQEKDPSTTYYIANINDLGDNYLTRENLIIEFDEPISKVRCSYYVAGREISSEERECSFNNTEFNYIEDKTQFHLIFEREGSYYVNYRIEVYDFSNNIRTINYLFIDRENPIIGFNSNISDQDQIEVNYTSEGKETKYNQSYINNGYRSEVSSSDSVNERINALGVYNLINNNLSYTINYFKYNYDVTYNNYVKTSDGNFSAIADGQAKAANQKYYILIKNTGDYVLKGNSGTCVSGDYCYIEDQRNYYPSLLTNTNYWTQLGNGESITNGSVGVYKVEYNVTDQSGNISETIVKTIYIVDTQTPTLIVNEELIEGLYGYHQSVRIRFDNENEYGFYRYTCNQSVLTCVLPVEIFAPASNNTIMAEVKDSTSIESNAPGIYKIYFHDLGYYVDSTICTDISDCASNTITVKTLKYNYREYQYVIDITPPALNIIAIVDQDTNKLYYEASLTQEEYVYCVRGLRGETIAFGTQNVNCREFLTGTPETEASSDGKSIKYLIRNSNGEIVYEETFEKLDAYAQKYFYNTYYYKNGEDFIEYSIGANYDEDNVYIINSIKLYFREDGKYLIKAVDKAGNQAGRINNVSYDIDESTFEIDNTAPTYNKEQNAATGINYWYSVPSRVINGQNITLVNSVVELSNVEKSYNITNSGLNNNFFYAFATKKEASDYLRTIYAKHINAQADNNCNVLTSSGFNYSYYDPTTETIQTDCFVGENGETNKTKALDEIMKLLSSVIYPTFSGNLLFGDPTINQIACDSTVSGDCINSKDMYKFVYLKEESNVKTIVETCTETTSITCTKINVKIVRASNGLTSNYEIGESNTADSQSIIYYSKYRTGSTSVSTRYTASGSVSLNANTYYIFEERDIPITYTNYAVSGTIEHYNTTYYAIYVDNNSYLSVFPEEDEVISNSSIINTDGNGNQNINSDKYYLILKNNNDPDFINNYEIHELWDENGKLIEVYSYVRLLINGVWVNLNDYFVKEGDTYYYRIGIAKEQVTNVQFIDRAGNVTRVDISHSQIAPSINLVYDGENGDQTVTLTIRNSNLTTTQTSSIKLLFSKDDVNYSESLVANIKTALLCQSEPIGYEHSCASIYGRGAYSVVIENKEDLYGFFKISLNDTHGNTNEIKFIYNPVDLSANYTTSDLKFIDSGMDEQNVRMITNQNLMLEWDNTINYIILYKETSEGLSEVCNTINMGTDRGNCGVGDDNTVSPKIEDGQYVTSTLYYSDEGYYQAKIINRQSVTINNICVKDGVVQEECKAIKTHTSNICSWENNPDYCGEALNMVDGMVYRVNVGGNSRYTRFEIDKTAPNYSASNFEINLPTGADIFRNNGEYINAEVLVKWEDKFVDLVYTCRYTDAGVTETCAGNHTGFSTTQQYLFSVSNKLSTEYTFYFVDYAGNSTVNNALTFTIRVILPEIKLFEVDENGAITNNEVLPNQKTRRNTELVCVEDGKTIDCNIYNIRLFRYSGSGYQEISIPNIIKVSENFENTYRYIVAIKNTATGYVYENLSVEYIFTIDKLAPNISIEGNEIGLSRIYKGDVRVLIGSNGTGTIYNNCVMTGEDASANAIYDCNEIPLVAAFTSNYTLTDTGIYRVIATDEIGNVTTGSQVRYVHIDNQNPEITIIAKTTYIDYALSENGYTNASVVVVESKDNNEGSYFMYRKKAADGLYGEWVTHTSSLLEISEEGFYEVKPVDIVGNEGIERHFIIYRQTPQYYVYVNNRINTVNDILTEDAFVTWDEPRNDLQAPIIKVTMNGQVYQKRTTITETGEYVFVFTDLAGNSTTHKITINKSDRICLDNVSLVPNKQFLFPSNAIRFSGGEGYEFKANDVIIFATPTNYYGGSSSCGTNVLSYKSIDKNFYIVVSREQAAYVNSHKDVGMTTSQEYIDKINELGGYVYAIIVDKDVARKDLGFEIGENFFTRDPLGWSLIIIAGIGLIYVSLKVVVFKKKVKVLK